jgi:hypothetical protein
MQLAELDRGRPNLLHPAFMANVLRNESGPNGDGLARPTTGCGLETHATRSLVPEDAEGMQVLRVRDLTSLVLVIDWRLCTEVLPAELHLLLIVRIEKVLETFSDAMLILTLHCDSSAKEKNHSCELVREIASSDRALMYSLSCWTNRSLAHKSSLPSLRLTRQSWRQLSARIIVRPVRGRQYHAGCPDFFVE